MGIFSFMMGTVLGVYVAQNYNVPSVYKLYQTGTVIAQDYEQKIRKAKKNDDGDSS